MMGEAEYDAESSPWPPLPDPELPLWQQYGQIRWFTPAGVAIGFDLGDSVTEAPLLTLQVPGQEHPVPVAAFSDWNMAVATLTHMFTMFPQQEDWVAQREWVQAVHAEAMRREVIRANRQWGQTTEDEGV